jgi:amidophosphoribosyltransferase
MRRPEVHFRIASPPITHPDYYGIDTPEQTKLLAATHDLEACGNLSERIHSPSRRSTESTGRWDLRTRSGAAVFTDHCFTGDYPTPLTDLAAQEASPRQLSLLAEAI